MESAQDRVQVVVIFHDGGVCPVPVGERDAPNLVLGICGLQVKSMLNKRRNRRKSE